jgi:hypothetical protein
LATKWFKAIAACLLTSIFAALYRWRNARLNSHQFNDADCGLGRIFNYDTARKNQINKAQYLSQLRARNRPLYVEVLSPRQHAEEIA